jgi:hypothetical protein
VQTCGLRSFCLFAHWCGFYHVKLFTCHPVIIPDTFGHTCQTLLTQVTLQLSYINLRTLIEKLLPMLFVTRMWNERSICRH